MSGDGLVKYVDYNVAGKIVKTGTCPAYMLDLQAAEPGTSRLITDVVASGEEYKVLIQDGQPALVPLSADEKNQIRLSRLPPPTQKTLRVVTISQLAGMTPDVGMLVCISDAVDGAALAMGDGTGWQKIATAGKVI